LRNLHQQIAQASFQKKLLNGKKHSHPKPSQHSLIPKGFGSGLEESSLKKDVGRMWGVGNRLKKKLALQP